MTFSLSKQSQDVTTPLPRSSAPCPTQPALSNTDKGLIAVGVVLAVVTLWLLGFLFARYCLKRGRGKTEAEDQPRYGVGTPLPGPLAARPHVPLVPSGGGSRAGYAGTGAGTGPGTRTSNATTTGQGIRNSTVAGSP